MTKGKLVMKIESYSNKDGMLLLSVDDAGVRTMLKDVVSLCDGKYSGYARIEISPPYRPRTTGAGSQNSHIWGHIQQIAEATGNDIQDVEDAVKERALKRGYPYKMNPLTGKPKPASMTTINTAEASMLIEELYAVAAELGINLEEA